jgi:hypothetical protein
VIKRISGTARDSAYFEQHYIVASGVDCKLQAGIFFSLTADQFGL